MLDLRPAVGHGDEVLRARLHPSHRAPQPRGGRGDDEVLGRDDELGAEPPTDVGRDDANRASFQAERIGDVVAHVERDLRRHPDREPLVRRVDRDGVRLHRHGRDSLVDEPAAHHDIRAGEDVLVPSLLEPMRDVRAGLGEQERRPIGGGGLRTHDHGQGIEVDEDRFRPVLRMGRGVG